MPFNTPILFLIFNRPETTVAVFERIRIQKPKYLYIAGDGSRNTKPNEDKLVLKTREIINKIDWDCEVKTLFRSENLGCGKAVSQAITWFFENEEMGIILEDDCLPDFSFFNFCEELLIKYRNDKSVMMIAGNNSLEKIQMNSSYFFSNYPLIWGWASWRRAWKFYEFKMQNYILFKNKNKINNILRYHVQKVYWLRNFEAVYEQSLDTWDYQWILSIWDNDGFCIIPSNNLISNIGFNEDATHTTDSKNRLAKTRLHSINILIHPSKIKINKKLDMLISKYHFGIHIPTFIERIKLRLKLI
jgi:hypothetical protein